MPHAPVIDLARERLAIRLIDKRQHRGGMGVVDEFVRQEGVQQRLDRRVGRASIEQVQALHVDHGLVGERIERASLRSGSSFTAGRPAARYRPCRRRSP